MSCLWETEQREDSTAGHQQHCTMSVHVTSPELQADHRHEDLKTNGNVQL